MPTPKSALPLVAALLLLGSVTTFTQTVAPPGPASVAKLTAVLQSTATEQEKAAACRQLAIVGTPDAIKVLASLLPDAKLSHMARYALEPMPSPVVDETLLQALAELKGRQLVGVIHSLGVRRTANAVKPLSAKLQDPDPDVAQNAARALGSIGTADAAKALTQALGKVSAANQLACCEGALRCAEALYHGGKTKDALALYLRLREVSNAPHQVRAAALRGAILLDEKKAPALVREALQSSDYVLTAAAVRAVLEEPRGTTLARVLATELKTLPEDRQILVIQILGDRGNAELAGSLIELTRAGSKPVRLAAIRALPMLRQASVTAPLLALLKEPDTEISQTAQESLAAIPGSSVDDEILRLLRSGEAAQRLSGLDLIARRRMTTALPALVDALGDADAKVRTSAFKRMGELGTVAEIPAVLRRLLEAKETADIDNAGQTLSAICGRARHPEAQGEQLIQPLAQAQPAQKCALLDVLSTTGGINALAAARAAVNDSNAEVRSAALRSIASWKTSDAAPELLALAKAANNPGEKALCLRAYLGWARNSELPADKRLTMCQQAAPLVQQADEKKLLLGALGSVHTVDSLAMVAPYLADAATREEASAATAAIADQVLKSGNAQQAAKLVEPLQKAAQATTNEDLVKRLKGLLDQAQKKAASQ